MRWIKYFATVGLALIILFTISLSVTLLLLDDDTYRTLAQDAVKRFTDLELEITGPFSADIGLSTKVTAEKVLLRAPASYPEPRELVFAERFAATVNLPKLLYKTVIVENLEAHGVRIHGDRQANLGSASSQSEEATWWTRLSPSPWLPVFGRVDLGDIRILLPVGEANLTEIFFNRLELKKSGADQNKDLKLTADGHFFSHPFHLTGSIGTLEQFFDAQSPYPLTIDLDTDLMRTNLKGHISLEGLTPQLDLSLASQSAEVAKICKVFGIETPPLGNGSLAAHITGDTSNPDLTQLQLHLAGPSGLNIEAHGMVQALWSLGRPKIDITARIRDKALLDWLLPQGFRLFDRIDLTTKLHGREKGYIFEEIRAKGTGQGLAVQASGSIGFSPGERSPFAPHFNLPFRFQADSLQAFGLKGADRLPTLGRITGAARLKGNLSELSLEETEVRSLNKAGLEIQTSGTLTLITPAKKKNSSPIRFKTTVSAPRLSSLLVAMGQKALPLDFEPLWGAAQVNGSFDKLSMEKIDLRMGETNTAELTAAGRIGEIPLSGPVAIRDASFSGQFSLARWPQLLASPDNIPRALETLEGTYGLEIKDEGYQLSISEATLGTPPIFDISATGFIDNATGKQKLSSYPQQWEVALSTTTKRLETILDRDQYPLPESRNVTLTGHLNITPRSIEAFSLMLNFDTLHPHKAQLQGSITHHWDRQRTTGQVRLTALAQPWLRALGLPENDSTNNIFCTIDMLHKDNRYVLRSFDLETDGLEQIKAQLSGTFQVAPGNQVNADLNIRTLVGDPHYLYLAMGKYFPFHAPLSIEGRLRSNAGISDFGGEVILGKNAIRTDVTSDFTKKRPRIDIRLKGDQIEIPEFFLRTKAEDSPEGEASQEEPPPTKSKVFSASEMQFNYIRNWDLNLEVDIERLFREEINITQIKLKHHLKDGRFHIDPLSFNHLGGYATLTGKIDTSADQTLWELDLLAKAINLQRLVKYFQKTSRVAGDISIATKLTAEGNSIRDVTASLDGDVGLAIKDGQIPRGINLLAADAFNLLLTVPRAKQEVELDCFVARLIFEKGVGRFGVMSLETDAISAKGAGMVDLNNETIELIIQPKQKKRLVFRKSSPVEIQGALLDPKVSKMPYHEAAKLYGDLVIPVIGVSDRVLGYLWQVIQPEDAQEDICGLEQSTE